MAAKSNAFLIFHKKQNTFHVTNSSILTWDLFCLQGCTFAQLYKGFSKLKFTFLYGQLSDKKVNNQQETRNHFDNFEWAPNCKWQRHRKDHSKKNDLTDGTTLLVPSIGIVERLHFFRSFEPDPSRIHL